MKAFLITCSCAERHDQSNSSCPVELMMYLITAHDMKDMVHDILDVQPVMGDHKDVKP